MADRVDALPAASVAVTVSVGRRLRGIAPLSASAASCALSQLELDLGRTSFDVEQLPFARGPFGYFVGEYEGLTSTGNTFRPLFAIGTGNRLTDIVTANVK